MRARALALVNWCAPHSIMRVAFVCFSSSIRTARVVPKSKEIQETMTTMAAVSTAAVAMEAAEMCEYKRKCEIIAEVIRFVQINDFVFLHRLSRFKRKWAMVRVCARIDL